MRKSIENKNGYLYRHVRADTDKVFYIGIGTTKNYSRAYSKNGRNRYWKNITNKTEYLVEIVLDDIPIIDLKLKEIEFIKLYGRKDLKAGTLCNMSDGGEGRNGCKSPSNKKGKSLSEIHKDPEIAAKQKKKLQSMCNNYFDKHGCGYWTGKTRNNWWNKGKRPVPVEESEKPFIITVLEKDKERYEITCKSERDFFEKVKMEMTNLHILKKQKMKEVVRRSSATKHMFPVGTILEFKFVESEN